MVKGETPVATIDQMKSLIVESEKTMKELLIQQANVGNKGGAQGGNKNQGGKDGNKGSPHGPGKCTPSGQCYNCQKYGHFRHDCKNPYVPHSTGQQFQMPQAPGLNVHAQTFAPPQYQMMAPHMPPPVMAAPVPQFSQHNAPQMAPNPRPVVNHVPQAPVMQHAPGPGQQPLN